MKKFKAIASVLLAAATVLSLTACEEEGVNPNSGAPNSAAPSTTASVQSTTTYAENAGVNEAVKNVDVTSLDDPDIKVTKRIKWLAWNDWIQDETGAAAVLFKEVYGIPESGDDPESAGQIFENASVAYADRYEALGKYIASDDSPDLFPFEDYDYPTGAVLGRYNAIDDVVDLSSPKYNGTREIMKQYELNGKNYCQITSVLISNYMYYRPNLLAAIGAEDPYELFQKGEWTWDKFLEIARLWQDSDEGKYVIDGYNPEISFLATTGKPMVTLENNQLVNNLYSAEFDNCEQNMISVLQSEDLRYPRQTLNNSGINEREWYNGNILFHADGDYWIWKDRLAKWAISGKFDWGPEDVMFVPFPKATQDSEYYEMIKLECQMYVKGSKNPEGVRAWFDCMATVANDPDIKKASREQALENYHFTEKMLDFHNQLTALDGTSPVTLVAEFRNALDKNHGMDTNSPVNSILTVPYLEGESYTQLREQNNPEIQDSIDTLNEKIKGL